MDFAPKDHFLTLMNLSEHQAQELVANALKGADDGELFLESKIQESLVLEDGRLTTSSYSNSQGYGLRRVEGAFAALVHGNDLNPFSIRAAAKDLKAVSTGEGARTFAAHPGSHAPSLYAPIDPLAAPTLESKIALLQEIDRTLRARDLRIKQVTVSMTAERQGILIVRPDGPLLDDVRPLVRLNIRLILEANGRREEGYAGAGGRYSYDHLMTQWPALADEALRQADVMLQADAAPVGQMPVILSNGWSGVLLHEAVGHGLEGDFNRRGTSAFSGLIGQQVAAKGVTVIDDGTLADRRGSLTIDDEGTASHRTVLIEDGVLKGYMQDRLNARLMGMQPTGNGRRQSYAHLTMPRMTNTVMTGGTMTPEEIIANTQNGLYAKTFGGGSVDITSGRFVFNVTEGYLVENGKITRPVKGASLIGSGPEALKYVDMVGNDMAIDHGIGTCGKDGQSVPVGVGQPTLRLSAGITVGGTGK